MENLDAKRACPHPCTVIQSTIRPGSSEATNETRIRLLFDDLVVYSHIIVNYGFTDFLVDLGSSVGLWFGLSVFGLADLGILVLDFLQVKVMEKINKN